MTLSLYATQALLPDGQLQPARIVVEEGKISAVEATTSPAAADYQLHDDEILAPGLIDIFVHGMLGADVMDATPKALDTIGRELVSEGVTSYLATTMTQTEAAISAALENVAAYRRNDIEQGNDIEQAELLGVHLEGPYLHRDKVGAQASQLIVSPDVAQFKRWQTASCDLIKVVTYAPECAGAAALTAYLKTQGIVASIGHSAASMAETEKAIEQGMHLTTHFYNAMSGLSHREPGVVPAVLLQDEVMVQLIVDGVHLHPDCVRFSYAMLGKNRIILASDAMRGKGMSPGEYDLGGQKVAVSANAARLVSNGALAGSVLRMNDAIRLMQAYAGCDFATAIQMATHNPAKLLGLSHKGCIQVGADADFVVFDRHCCVKRTFCRGQVAYVC